jgi:hypothetical protein
VQPYNMLVTNKFEWLNSYSFVLLFKKIKNKRTRAQKLK